MSRFESLEDTESTTSSGKRVQKTGGAEIRRQKFGVPAALIRGAKRRLGAKEGCWHISDPTYLKRTSESRPMARLGGRVAALFLYPSVQVRKCSQSSSEIFRFAPKNLRPERDQRIFTVDGSTTTDDCLYIAYLLVGSLAQHLAQCTGDHELVFSP